MKGMKMKWLGLGLGLVCATWGFAQNEVDYLRYAHLESSGSVRTWGMGGAFSSLGADLGSLGVNPGGLGMYRRGEMGMALGVASVRTRVLYGTSAERNSASRLTLPSAGLVLTYPTVHPDWPFFSLGVTYSQRANFDATSTLNPSPRDYSLLETFQAQAEGVTPDDFQFSNLAMYAGLAWDTYLLDPADPLQSPPDSYVTAIPDGKVLVDRRTESSGTFGETSISFAGAFRDRIYMGGTIGLPRVDFQEAIRTREVPQTDSLALFDWSLSEELQVEGSGFNAKLGFIAVLTEWVRVGLAYHSPTRLRLDETFITRMDSQFDNGTTFSRTSPTLSNSYVIRTPARLIGGISFLMGKAGLITADVERIDYRGGDLRPTAFSGLDVDVYNDVNATIAEIHDVGYIARAGAEFRIQREYRLRFGGSYETSPYNAITADIFETLERYTATLGFGWRRDKYYVNGAYRRAWFRQDTYPYGWTPSETPGTIERSHGSVVIGAGIRL